MYQNPYIKIKPKTRKPYTEIYLIRHCNPDYSLESKLGERRMPLSKAGLKQRIFLTKKLVSLDLGRVYSSGINRAQETALLYAKKAKKEITVDDRLNEIDWKNWTRIRYFNMSEKMRTKHLKNYRDLDKQLDKMQVIARRALADIFKKNKGHRVAIFSHGNFIKALLTGILNADVIGFLSLEIFQSSISKLVIDRDGYIKISFINDVSHLPVVPQEDLFITLHD
jgi:broad specificity phosphatase PhoE